MNDTPTVQQRTADKLAHFFQPRWPMTSKTRAANAAAALAAAGLLADPTTSRTDTEQAVIEAAICAGMSDITQRAADFITKHAGPSWRWEAGELARAMSDAGLLAAPATDGPMTVRDEFGQPVGDWDERDCALISILEDIASPDIDPEKSLAAYVADIYDLLLADPAADTEQAENFASRASSAPSSIDTPDNRTRQT